MNVVPNLYDCLSYVEHKKKNCLENPLIGHCMGKTKRLGFSSKHLLCPTEESPTGLKWRVNNEIML